MNTTSEFQSNYAQMTDEELLCVAADRENLIEEGVIALDAELAKRGLRPEQAKKFKRSVERIKARDAVGTVGLSFRGWGRQFLGASNYTANREPGFEEFDSTLWYFVFFVPLLPLITVRIRRRLRRKSLVWSFGKTDFTPVQLRGLDFMHVFITYGCACVEVLLGWHLLQILLSALLDAFSQ